MPAEHLNKRIGRIRIIASNERVYRTGGDRLNTNGNRFPLTPQTHLDDDFAPLNHRSQTLLRRFQTLFLVRFDRQLQASAELVILTASFRRSSQVICHRTERASLFLPRSLPPLQANRLLCHIPTCPFSLFKRFLVYDSW